MNNENDEIEFEIEDEDDGLSFKLDSEGKLFAVYVPVEYKSELSMAAFKKHLNAAKMSHLLIHDHLVSEFLRQYREDESGEGFECEIGERRDAGCDVHVSHDKLQAFLSITPSFGGKRITIDEVQQQLKKHRISWGLVPMDVIEAILEEGAVTNFLIAQGLPAEDGVDARFRSYIPETHERKPLIDENGNVDHRDLGDIIVVHQGDVIMEKIPPIVGKKGRNVLGEIIEPNGGHDIPFSADKKGVEVNPANPNQLLSTRTGQPIIVPNGIIVLPIFTTPVVDLSSGHIRFDGSVIVQGDVREGMKVHALEDITIEGDVVDAYVESIMGSITIKGGVTGNTQLIASSDVTVKGGVQGYDDKKKKPAKPDKNKESDAKEKENNDAKIVARGSVVVSFAENFYIEAGIDILIEKYAMNSRLLSQNRISAGRKLSGDKPALIGGETLALTFVKARTIGSDMGVKTIVQVGSNPIFQRRIQELNAILNQNKEEQEMLTKILTFMENNPEKRQPEMVEKSTYTLNKIVMAAQAYESELRELNSNIVIVDNARVVADKAVYTGTQIRINNSMWQAQENRGRSVFTVKRREIVIN